LHEFTRIIILTIKFHELKSDLSDFIGVIFHLQFVLISVIRVKF